MAIEDTYELAYREAVRALEHQRAVATELRNRAGLLLATASVAVSLLGHELFREHRSVAWVTIVCFTLLTVCVLAIVWPHGELSYEADPQALLVERLSSEGPALPGLRLELVAHMARSQRANGRRLMQTVHVLRIGVVLLATQLVLTLLAGGVIV